MKWNYFFIHQSFFLFPHAIYQRIIFILYLFFILVSFLSWIFLFLHPLFSPCCSSNQASGSKSCHPFSQRIVQLLDEFMLAGVNGIRILFTLISNPGTVWQLVMWGVVCLEETNHAVKKILMMIHHARLCEYKQNTDSPNELWQCIHKKNKLYHK